MKRFIAIFFSAFFLLSTACETEPGPESSELTVLPYSSQQEAEPKQLPPLVLKGKLPEELAVGGGFAGAEGMNYTCLSWVQVHADGKTADVMGYSPMANGKFISGSNDMTGAELLDGEDLSDDVVHREYCLGNLMLLVFRAGKDADGKTNSYDPRLLAWSYVGTDLDEQVAARWCTQSDTVAFCGVLVQRGDAYTFETLSETVSVVNPGKTLSQYAIALESDQVLVSSEEFLVAYGQLFPAVGDGNERFHITSFRSIQEKEE